MDNHDIKCRIMEEELRQFWPQWHVTRRLGGGSFGDVYQVYRDNCGIRMVSAVKVIQVGGAETLLLQGAAQPVNNDGRDEIPEALRNEIQIMETLPVFVPISARRTCQNRSGLNRTCHSYSGTGR